MSQISPAAETATRILGPSEDDGPGMVLGIMPFGTNIDAQTSFALLDQYVDEGGIWLDTANCYSYWADPSGHGGASEELLGQWLRARPGKRDSIRIATKVGCEPVPLEVNPSGTEGLGAEVIAQAFETSLRRMGVEFVDMYWAHRDDLKVDQEETVAAFAALVADGSVGRWGYSNAALWRVERARGIARAAGVEAPSALQLRYSYLQPRPMVRDHIHDHRFGWVTDETLDYAVNNPDVEVWAYSPLMTGAYDRPEKPLNEAFDHPGNTRRLAVLTELAHELGVSRTELVASWMTGGSPAVIPIVGVSTPEQLSTAMRATRSELTDEVRAALDEPW